MQNRTGAQHRSSLIRFVAPILWYVASRIVVLGTLMSVDSRVISAFLPGVGPHRMSLRSVLAFWDGTWYLGIARLGYPAPLPTFHGHVAANSAAFLPLYPITVWALHSATGVGFQLGAAILSGLFGLAAALVIWAWAATLWTQRTANRVVALWSFFPGSFALSFDYADGLGIALCAGALLMLLNRRWLAAGILAALATATVPQALAIVPACAWAASVAVVQRRQWRALIAPLLAPMGFLGYFGYLWIHTGNADAWFATQRGWDQRIDFTAGYLRLRYFLDNVSIHSFITGTIYDTAGAELSLLVALVGIIILVTIRPRPPLALFLFSATVIALAVVSSNQGMRPRFVLFTFPLIAAFAYRLRGIPFFLAVLCSAALMVAVTVVTVTTLSLTP